MIGRVLRERYRVDRVLGEGAFGVVFCCYDLNLKRNVAVKMLSGTIDGDKGLDAFLAEGQKLAALNHPNIVQIYDFGFHEKNPFIVMEYLEGKPLREILAGPRPPLRDLLELMRQVALGLEVLHSRSIVHRDLSLNNIIVTPNNSAKLLDLGLAKDLAAISTAVRDGYLVGTIAYISPEQIEGQRVTTASEVFSFGTILYEVVTGVHPFQAEHYMSMLYNIANREPAPLDVYLSNPDPQLASLVRNCLSKDSSDRPADMGAVARSLQKILGSGDLDSSQPREAHAPGTGISMSRNPYHNRAMIRRKEDFYGRSHEIRRIFSKINATPPGSVSVVGDRRIGKSSLLNHVYLRHTRDSYLEQPEKVVMIFLDFQEHKDATIESFVRVLLKTAQLELRGRLDLSGLTNDLEGIKGLVQTLHEHGFRLVIILDEFEAITRNDKFDLEFFSFLRFLANHYNVGYLTSSTKDLQLLCHANEIKDSPFFNIFSTMRLSVFRHDEALELISVPSEKIGKPLAPFSDRIIGLAGLFPFFLQIACSHCIDYLEENPDRREPDFVEVQKRFYVEVRLHYRHLWNNFDQYEKSAIRRVADTRKIPNSLEHVLQELSERHLVEIREGTPRLFSNTFEDFIRQETSIKEKASLFGWILGRKP